MVELGLARSMSAANDWLRKGQRDGTLKFYTRYGIKERKSKKPEYWYYATGSDVFKRGNERHEIHLSEILFLLRPYATEVRRGVDVDQETLPDAEVVIGGVRHLIECDTGHMSMKQLRRRFKKYAEAKCDDTILFVTLLRDRRVTNVLERASKDVKDNLCVTTFAALFENPLGTIWQDADGERFALELTPA